MHVDARLSMMLAAGAAFGLHNAMPPLAEPRSLEHYRPLVRFQSYSL